jgi:hypothetical protein
MTPRRKRLLAPFATTTLLGAGTAAVVTAASPAIAASTNLLTNPALRRCSCTDGVNDTGPVFTIADAQQLLSWAQSNHIGRLTFWSESRDNGGCPSGGVSPTCSGISQSTYQFTSTFHPFTG